METRTITEIKIYKLILNNMRGNTENCSVVAVSDSRQKLIDWAKSQEESTVAEGAPSFPIHGDSHTWHKTYRKDSPLEWYNPANLESDRLGMFGHGIDTEWVSQESINRWSGIKLF